jgi:hypothetical protein
MIESGRDPLAQLGEGDFLFPFRDLAALVRQDFIELVHFRGWNFTAKSPSRQDRNGVLVSWR